MLFETTEPPYPSIRAGTIRTTCRRCAIRGMNSACELLLSIGHFREANADAKC